MSDTGFGPAVTPGEATAAAAEQLAAAAAAAPSGDAGPSIEAMQAQAREVLLPMERRIDAMMAQFEATRAESARQIAELQAQLASAKASAGPPAVEQYANGVATLIKAHADANPDLGAEPFAAALDAAAKLQAAASEAVTSRDPAQVTQLAGQLEKWAARFRGKHLDFSSLLADLELLDEAAARLAA